MTTHTRSFSSLFGYIMGFTRLARSVRTFQLITVVLIGVPAVSSAQEQPVWRFSVLASVKDTLVERFGGLDSITALLQVQMDSVNGIFNNYDVFEGTFEYALDSVQVFTRNRFTQVELPHPEFDYHVVYDCARDNMANWIHPPHNAVLLVMYHTDEMPAPFTRMGHRTLAHELCHGRGAIDIYALIVDFTLNGVNSTGYYVDRSIMSGFLPGGWAPHTINIVNRNADHVLTYEQHAVSQYFPHSINTRVVDINGLPVPEADINIYEHQWYDYDLAETPLFTLAADSAGVLDWDINYFQWGRDSQDPPNAWDVINSVLLFEVTWQEHTHYAWLSVLDMNMAWFADSTADYIQTITMPFDITNPSGTPGLPTTFVLRQNYPNPFNASTTICVDQSQSGDLRLEIVNTLGKVTAVLHDGYSGDGDHCWPWDATSAASGVYFCRARFEGVDHTIKMILVN